MNETSTWNKGFDFANTLFVDHEQDHVVFGFNTGFAVGDHHLLVADDRANPGAFRKRQVFRINRPTTLEESSSPCATASIASAMPRRNECTASTSPWRMCARMVPTVTTRGAITISISSWSSLSQVYRAIDQGHDAFGAHFLGDHACQDIDLIALGDRDKSVE